MGAKNKKLSVKELIEKCRTVHGMKYEYDKVIYKNLQTPIVITCKIHGDFLQSPANHIYNQCECPKCVGKFRYTTETFIKESKLRHKNKYNYDISLFTTNGYNCDKNNTGVYIDVDHKLAPNDENNEKGIITILIKCNNEKNEQLLLLFFLQ